ncbi:MAG TPA: methylmalonic aciduria and homocystinuria type D protein [Chroococcidiopsis sp.]
MQWSVHSPSAFIQDRAASLLPDWSCAIEPVLIESVLIVLQPCDRVLLERTLETEAQKERLRQNFLEIGAMVVLRLVEQGYRADLFDPSSGFPVYSSPGHTRLDDVAIARACLGYPVSRSGGCAVILHPLWGSAVYPSTVVSSAPPWVIEAVAASLLGCPYRPTPYAVAHSAIATGGRIDWVS